MEIFCSAIGSNGSQGTFNGAAGGQGVGDGPVFSDVLVQQGASLGIFIRFYLKQKAREYYFWGSVLSFQFYMSRSFGVFER